MPTLALFRASPLFRLPFFAMLRCFIDHASFDGAVFTLRHFRRRYARRCV